MDASVSGLVRKPQLPPRKINKPPQGKNKGEGTKRPSVADNPDNTDSNPFKTDNKSATPAVVQPKKVKIPPGKIRKLKRRIRIAYRRLRRVRKWAGRQSNPAYKKAAQDVYQSLSKARKQIKSGHVQAAVLNYLRATVLLGRLKTNRQVEQNLSDKVEAGTSLISQRSSSTRI
ncbi:MAG: hypothetical protein HQ564_00675, partial [Candidatus Saganbacteria bacterium]|nr:hypothetical protein [Candidatus Saganbacteria bacterium]